jgi:hypothetical protein
MKRILGAVLISAGMAVLGILAWRGNPPGGDRRYLILLQNQMELRPTGGFLGSYAIAKISNGKLVEVAVQDIYEPDGRLTEYIRPPEPIQEAFQMGTLRLRDANWDPDFPTTAKTLMWYLAKAGEGEFDGVIATNLLVFQQILAEIGPIKLVDYDEDITADNLWEKAQFYSQQGFFPGSKQKREFLGDLSKALRNRLETSSPGEKIRLIKLIIRLLAEKQIMVYLLDGKIQSGQVKTVSCPAWLAGCVADSLMVVEANLGVNKANCCIDRRVRLELSKQENNWHHQLFLTFENRSGNSLWGGKYKAWVRVNNQGFWAEVPVGEEREYTIEYDLPVDKKRMNQPIFLLIQKQSGIEVWPIEIVVRNNGKEKTIKADLRRDKLWVLR